MAKKLDVRIEERNRLAEMNMRDKNPASRTIAKTGLALANTWDRITAPFKSDRAVFLGASGFGVGHGAAWGATAGILAIAAVAGTALAAFALPIFLTTTAAGAVISGIKNGQTSLENHQRMPNDQFADSIAVKSGAVPGPNAFLDKAPKKVKWDIEHPHAKSRALADVDETLKNARSFTEREDARRAAANGPRTLA